MGFDALIDNSERSSIVDNLKDEINCSICCSIFEDSMKLDCCDGHLCKKCFNDVKKNFQSCPLCRKINITAKHSRLMVTLLSQLKLLCPAKECGESVAYSSFANHKKTCPALNEKPCPGCQKVNWKNDLQVHVECFLNIASANEKCRKKEAANLAQIKNLEAKNKSLATKTKKDQTRIKNLEKKIKSLEQSKAQKDTQQKIQRQKKEIATLHEKLKQPNPEIKKLTQLNGTLKKQLAARNNEIKNLKQKKGTVKGL